MRAIIAAALAVLAAPAWAITGAGAIGPAGPGVIVRTANSAQFVYGGTALPDISRAYANVGSAGDVAARDTVRVGAVPGSPSVVVSRTATKAAIAAAGAVALKSLPVVATGVALWDIYNSMRVHPDGQGGIRHDPGAAPGTAMTVLYKASGGGYTTPTEYTSWGAAAAAWCTRFTDVTGGAPCSLRNSYETPGANPRCGADIWTNNAQGVLAPYSNIGCIWREAESPNVCPASIDFENPANSVPAGEAPMADGKCRQAPAYRTPISPEAVADLVPSFPSVQFSPEIVRDIVERGSPIDAGPASVTGPGSTPGPEVTTTTTGPGGTTTSVQQTFNNYNYEGDTITWNISNVQNTTAPGGETTTTTTTGDNVKVCGLPGTPPCKMDESGTPEFGTPPSVTEGLAAADAAKRSEIVNAVPDPTFGFFGAPALVACSPFEMPNGIPDLNPCGVVEGIRGVMAYLWALAAAWLAIGMVRQTVTGG